MTEASLATQGRAAYHEVETDLTVRRRETVADGVVTLTLSDPAGSELLPLPSLGEAAVPPLPTWIQNILR